MRRKNRGSVNHLVQVPIVGLAVGVMGLLGYRQFVRLAHPSRLVVVAQSALSAGKVVEDGDVETVRRSSDGIPADAFSEPDKVTGRRLTRPKREGEAFVSPDFVSVTESGKDPLSRRIPEGRVLTTLTVANTTVPFGDFRQGDSVDILVSGQTQDRRRAARVVVKDAYLVGYVMPRVISEEPARGLMSLARATPKKTEVIGMPALLLALRPEDVLPLAEIDGSGLHVTLVLHSPVQEGEERLAVSRGPGPKIVDLIVGDKRERVIVP